MHTPIKLLATGLLISGPTLAQGPGPAPAGDQFQVNSYTTSVQNRPSIDSDAQGNFVVVWESRGSYGTDTSSFSIQGQRYDASGAPILGEFQVNSYTSNFQIQPSVAMDAQGHFVVAWESDGSYGTDTSNYSIQAQRYDATATPVGGQFQVNSYTSNFQNRPSVAMDAQGNFVVVWHSWGSYETDTSEYSVQAQRYDSTGGPVGGQFQVNSYTSNFQIHPSVAMDAQGNFVVGWESDGSYGTDNSRESTQGQLFRFDGTPVGDQFQINTELSYQSGPVMAMDAQGNFVAIWGHHRVFGRRYDAEGTPVGGRFQVNSNESRPSLRDSVAMDAQGNFVVVWISAASYGTDNDDGTVQAQRYDAAGTRVGGQFQVNSYTTDDQRYAWVSMTGQDDFVVVWKSDGSWGTDTMPTSASIQAQRYSTGMIFISGFESGDTSAWSSTVP